MSFLTTTFMTTVSRLPGLGPWAVEQTLRGLAKARTPVRVEVENTDINFFTILDLRREKVMMSRPAGITTQIKPGSIARFQLPNDRKKTLRLPVAVGNFQMTRGGPIFLCEIPKFFSPPPLRKSDRFNTSRFKNLQLVLSEQRKALRIVDLSEKGCKVYHSSAIEPGWLELGKSISGARIEIDNRVKMELEAIIPRSWGKKTLGFEFKISPSDNSLRVFAKLLEALDKAEHNRLLIQAS